MYSSMVPVNEVIRSASVLLPAANHWVIPQLRVFSHKRVKEAFWKQVGEERGEGRFNAIRNSLILLLLSSSRARPPNSLANHSCHF